MTKTIDARGLPRPQPALLLLAESLALCEGDIVEVIADCMGFEEDVRHFCDLKKKTLLWIIDDGPCKVCQIVV